MLNDSQDRKFIKDPKQEKLIAAMVDTIHSSALNGSGPGVGKTYCAVRVGLDRGAKRVLIIAQPKVYENFEETLKDCSGIQLLPAANNSFCGVSKNEALANKEKLVSGADGWFFVSREIFRQESWRKREVKHRNGKVSSKSEVFHYWDKAKGFDYVVYDECQMVASNTAKSTKSIRMLKLNAGGLKHLMSADWFGGEIANQFHVATTLWPEWMDQEYKNFIDWRDENCTTVYDHFAFDKKRITGEQWPGFFASTLPLYERIASPVRKPEPDRHYIELSPKERKLYNDLKKNLAAEVDGELFVVDDYKSLYMRLREANLGVFRPVDVVRNRKDEYGNIFEVDGQTIEYIPGDTSSTVDAIKEIMKDNRGEPVIVLTHSKKFANKAAVDLGGLAYTGSQTEAQKREAARLFVAGDVDVLVGTDAMCEGLDGLQKRCRIAVIASRPGRSYMTGQFIGRIARRGQEREPLVYELVRRDTIDTKVRGSGSLDIGIIERAVRKELMLNNAKSIV
jgi:hypothetical protein